MIGFVLVSQGPLAQAMLAALNETAGDQANAIAVGLTKGDNAATQRQQILDAIQSVDKNDGVMVFIDDLDGTTGHLAPSLFDQETIEVISGTNLPMLKKCAQQRAGSTLKALAELARDEGRKAITWCTA